MAVFFRTVCGALFIWFIFAIAKPLLFRLGLDVSMESIGAWGNSFGALNAMIGAIGFSAVAYTAWLQRRTLELQRTQIASTIKDQHRQRFEGQYIELLKLLREVREDVRFSFTDKYPYKYSREELNSGPLYAGLEAFRKAWDEVRLHVSLADTPTEIGIKYTTIVHSRYESNIGPYFRIVYTMLHMLKFDNTLEIVEKIRFANLLRSQLTSDELILHGLNGLSPVSKDFSDLIIEFRLLKYLPNDFRRNIMEKCYPAEAFLPRD